MRNQTIKAYIFDMDGTLVDNCAYHVAAWRKFSKAYGNMLSKKQILDWMGAQGSFYIEKIFGKMLPQDEVARLCEEKEALYRKIYKPELPDGLREWLDYAHARKIPCALATGGPKANVDFILDSLNLRADFAFIVDGSMYTHSKPDPECFLKAAELMGVEPSLCRVYEDAVNGIVAARAAGMSVVAITFTNPREVLEAAGANRVIDSYRELKVQPVAELKLRVQSQPRQKPKEKGGDVLRPATMKMALLRRAIRTGKLMFALMAGGGLSVPALMAGTDWRIVTVDQATSGVVVFQGSGSEAAANTNEAWRWTPSADDRIRAEDEPSFHNLDECKVVDFGATVLVNASGGGVAAIDVATTQCVWYAKATCGLAGPHSLARLPDGRVAVANSTGCDAVEIIDVRAHPFEPWRQRRVRAADVPGAHGVVWDVHRNTLFALGYTNLFEYAYVADRCELVELHRWRYDGPLGDPWGHDLAPDAQGGYFLTNHSGVWRFDPDRSAFSAVSRMRNVKSFSRDSVKGDLVQVPTEQWWSDRLLVVSRDGAVRTVGPFPGARFYKARWFQADARQMTWSDEFEGNALDSNRWSRCARGKSDWNRNMSERPDLVVVTNGMVVLAGVANADANADPRACLTGGISSRGKGTMRMGRVELRVKFEDHQQGAWPALWMCGNELDELGRDHPWNGEFDIVERLNGDPFVYQTVHSGWSYRKKRELPLKGGTAPIRQGDWNVYGFEITPDALVWSVNGMETFRYPRLRDVCDPDQWPFSLNYFFYLDMQLGGAWVGKVNLATLPVRMFIDWIRVYE